MGLRWILNGRVIDSGEPAAEVDTNRSNPVTAVDGRTYMDSTNATYLQDGTVIKSTDRVSIRAGVSDSLPVSGNISQVMGPPKVQEASVNSYDAPTDAILQAQRDSNAVLNDLRASRDAETARVLDKIAADRRAIASATNLVQTTDPVTGNRMWQVKRTQ